MRIKETLVKTHQRLLAWRPDRNNPCVRGLRQSRLSGFKEALKDDDTHYGWRLLMVIAFFLCLSYGIMLSLLTLDKYLTTPILHKFHDAGISIDKIPFPGVTMALPYLLRQSILDEAKKLHKKSRFNARLGQMNTKDKNGVQWTSTDVVKLLYMVNHFCEAGNTFGKKFEAINPKKSLDLHKSLEWVQTTSFYDDLLDETNKKKIIPFIKKGLLNCSEAIAACLWRGSKNKSCSDLFETAQTDVGTGCSFNKMPEEVLRKDKGLKTALHDHGKKFKKDLKLWENSSIDDHSFLDESKAVKGMSGFPRRQIVPGFDKGVSFLLKYPQEMGDVACPAIDGNDYVVCVHHPYEEPRVKRNGCFHVPRRKQVFIKVRPQVTLADKNIQSLMPDKRKCYFEKESPLGIFKRYTKSNCFKECLSTAINQTCKCLPLPMTGNQEPICSPLHWKCVKSVTDEFERIGYETRCSKCYRPCTEVIYRADATYSDLEFERPEAFNLSDNESYSLVHVFFDEESVIPHERSLQYDTNELIGIFGGIIGLTNGVDLLQILNILGGIAIACPFFRWIRQGMRKLAEKYRIYTQIQINTQAYNTQLDSCPAIYLNELVYHKRDLNQCRYPSFREASRNDMAVGDIESPTDHSITEQNNLFIINECTNQNVRTENNFRRRSTGPLIARRNIAESQF